MAQLGHASQPGEEVLLIVTARLPKGLGMISTFDLEKYVTDALASWGGQSDPEGDPLFDGLKVKGFEAWVKPPRGRSR
jgi:hypothetical protein